MKEKFCAAWKRERQRGREKRDHDETTGVGMSGRKRLSGTK